jgi:peptide/nickel transport system permease protein
MLGFVFRRTISALLVIITTSMLVFALFFFGPADPGNAICQKSGRCTPERVEQINKSLGFDEPVISQYAVWAKGVFLGRTVDLGGSRIECPAPCFGVSYNTRQPVTELLSARFPATVSLALGAAAIFFPLGVLLGTLAARKRGSALDRILVGSSLVMSSIPLLPGGRACVPVHRGDLGPHEQRVRGHHRQPVQVVPRVAAALAGAGGDPVDLLRPVQPRLDGRRAQRGLRAHRQCQGARQAPGPGQARPARRIVPVVTIFGLDLATLLAGTVFTEQIFGIDGIGRMALQAIGDKDFPIISATVLIAAILVVVANVIVDIVYSVIDPRVRLS